MISFAKANMSNFIAKQNQVWCKHPTNYNYLQNQEQ